MKGKCWVFAVFAFVLGLGMRPAWGAEPPQFPQNGTFTTLVTTPLAIEGLTGDNAGNLYTVGRNAGVGASCPVWKTNLADGSLVVVGFILAPSASTQCSPSGLAFNALGDLFVADGNRISFFTPNSVSPPTATVYATGVPGTNGVAFDRAGNLWTGDGTTGQGRVWRIPPGGGVAEEIFRIQPMTNSADFGGLVPPLGVGRANTTIPVGAAQNLVANGIAFNNQRDMFVIDTARGALWKVQFDPQGNLRSPTGCDTTFTANTLCLSNVFVAHPILEGGDGIALDVAGNIWVDANERNAVAVVTRDGRVREIFRNAPDTTTKLRNGGPLEFPTSPFLSGNVFCTANSDGDRRDNSPNTVGEIKPAGPLVGKISCMDEELTIKGLPLPVH